VVPHESEAELNPTGESEVQVQHRGLPHPTWLWRVAPYAIGALASFWLVDRIAAF
jgi:hypothetical protein